MLAAIEFQEFAAAPVLRVQLPDAPVELVRMFEVFDVSLETTTNNPSVGLHATDFQFLVCPESDALQLVPFEEMFIFWVPPLDDTAAKIAFVGLHAMS